MAEHFDLAALELLDITACQDRIVELQTERERKREYLERLQEKLKALNNELAARKEELDRSRLALTEEQAKNRKLAEQRRQSGEDGGQGQLVASDQSNIAKQWDKVRRFLEDSLMETALKNVKRNNLGIRIFDEMELIVEKPPEEQEQEAVSIDTVLITYVVPNSDIQYNLSYRVDRNTTTKKLREDACLYWNLSEVEYIFKTLDNSKVHDDLTVQSCFRKEEDSHLILAQKTPKSTTLMDSQVAAIGKKIGRKAKKKEETADDKGGVGKSKDFYEAMKERPGVWEFMTQRDRRPVTHLETIKLRNIIIYTAFIVLTVIAYNLGRSQSVEYYTRLGIVDATTEEYFDSDIGKYVPALENLTTRDDVYMWLMNSVPSQILSPTSPIRKSNYFPGSMQIRMQQVKAPSHSACSQDGDVPDEVLCYWGNLNTVTRATDDFENIRLYWQGCNSSNASRDLCGNLSVNYSGVAGVKGRPATGGPWQWKDEQTNWRANVYADLSQFQEYDSSGYAVEYNFQQGGTNITKEDYQEDMQILWENDWISTRTRSLYVEFEAYNPNFDYWISCLFMFELPPTSRVMVHSNILLYRPVHFGNWMDANRFVIDIIRAAIIVYIVTFNFYSEMMYLKSKERAPFSYLVTPNGIADLGIFGCLVYIIALRYIVLGPSFLSVLKYWQWMRGGFVSTRGYAFYYKQQLIFESVLMGFALFRWLHFTKMNRNIYIMWKTIEEAFFGFASVFFVVLALALGAAAFSHALWSFRREDYHNFQQAVDEVMTDLYDLYRSPLGQVRTQNPLYTCAFYIVFEIILLNVWTAILVEIYHRVRIQSGWRPVEYRWKEYDYVTWALYSPFQNIYLRYLRPNIEKPIIPMDMDD